MSNKGSSDLDVFNGLAKNVPSASPGPTSTRQPTAPPPPPIKGRTLVGLPTPPIPSKLGNSVPPPPPSRAGGPSLPSNPVAQHSGGSLPPPMPSSPAPGGAQGGVQAAPPKSVEMDWDDDDEQTTVYDKGSSEDSAHELLRGAAGPAPAPLPAAGTPAPPRQSFPPPPPTSRPAPPPTRPVNRPPQITPPVPTIPPQIAAQPAPIPNFRGSGRSKTPVVLGILAAVALVAIGFFLWPRSGSLIVTVAGPGGKPLDQVEILLNGKQECEVSPCTLSDLKPDTYMLRASAPGYQRMADEAIAINANSKTVRNLTLVRATGTGIKVIAEGSGLKLYVDGKEVGPLPQELKDMDPGEHVVKVAGNDRYETFEKTITVEPEQLQTIGPLRLKVLKGLAKIVPGEGADGARVLLVSGDDRRTLPQLPINLDIPTGKAHHLVATRPGYEEFRKEIEFEDGEAERTFEIALEESESQQRSSAAPRRAPPRSAPTPAKQPASASAPAPAQAASGSGTLNINSIPVSNIILDGKPLGTTPKVGVRVKPGSHTVVFVQGSKRKIASVTVGGGDTKTVAVRF